MGGFGVFSGFSDTENGKSKETFENKGAKGGQIVGVRGCVPRWLLGLIWECLRASAPIVHYHTKIAHFRHFGAIASPRSFNKSVLRAFLGGFFGFIGARGIFGCLVAFVGLVGLYACSVRRLGSEKRKPCKFY